MSLLARFLWLAAALATSQESLAQPASGHATLADPEGEPIVIGSAHRIKSSVYGNEQVLTVRLPRGYAENARQRYPVLFSIDTRL